MFFLSLCFTSNVIQQYSLFISSEWEWNFYGVSDKDQKWPWRKAINDKIATIHIDFNKFPICNLSNGQFYRVFSVRIVFLSFSTFSISVHHTNSVNRPCFLSFPFCFGFRCSILCPLLCRYILNEKCLHQLPITSNLFWHSFKLLLSDWIEMRAINFSKFTTIFSYFSYQFICIENITVSLFPCLFVCACVCVCAFQMMNKTTKLTL